MIASVRPNALRLATQASPPPVAAPRPALRPTLGRPVAARPGALAGRELRPVEPRVLVGGADPLARAGLRAALDKAGVVATDLSVFQGAVAQGDHTGSIAKGELVVWDLGGAARDPRLSAALAAGARVVVLVDAPSSSVAEHLAAGARGVLLREADGARLAAALAGVRAGIVVVDPKLVPGLAQAPKAPPPAEAAPQEPATDELTPREGEVLQHLSAGLANKEIAVKLGISDHTVKFHVNAILGKLGASTRTEAVVRGVRRGLVVL